MRVVWQKQRIPKAWRRAGGVLKPKEKGASDISQFRPICLLDVKGKIFFSIVAQRQDSLAKKDKRDLHVVFLNLANAFGSIPHNFLWESFNFFHVPEHITTLVTTYFQDLQLCFTTANNMAALGSRHHGRLQSVTSGFHNGHGSHYQGLKMGGRQGTSQGQAPSSTYQSIHG